ncbi:MAG: hypothetical protein J7K87_01760 [Candidatus Aenigmarchaeota archaeon]|nr:hypothetical protein [Candidatus Aenigmarchaeota archaeon]
MTNYRKGINFEFRVRNLFRKYGYQAERKAASAPYDIIVMKNGSVVFLVDAKKTSQKDKKVIYLKRYDVEKIIRESKKIGARPLIIYGFYKTPIYVALPEELIKKKVIKIGGEMTLEEFLTQHTSHAT